MWSPTLSKAVSGSVIMRQLVALLLVPLIGSMHLVAFIFSALNPVNPYLASIIGFATAAMIAIVIYIAFPVIIIKKCAAHAQRLFIPHNR